MKIDQKSIIDAPRDKVWGVLMDVPRAAGLIPGVKDVKPTGENTYTGTMQVGVGPMKLNLQGDLRANPDPSTHKWHLEGQAQDRRLGGGLRVIVDAQVDEAGPNKTDLAVSTDIQFMGRLGTLGQPLIRSRANSQMKEFAQNLEKEVKKG
jgi:carbon monoxide dehydrogenase subunit G